MEIRSEGLQQRTQRVDRSPADEADCRSDHAERGAAVNSPEKDAGESKRHRKNLSRREPWIALQYFFADGQHADDRQNQGCCRGENRMTASATQHEHRRHEKNEGDRSGGSPRQTPSKGIENHMEEHGNGQQHGKLQALAALVALKGHGRKKNDPGKLHAGKIDALDQPFSQAGVIFENSREEMEEGQRPGVGPNLDAGRGAVLLDRDKYADENGKNNDDGKFVG